MNIAFRTDATREIGSGHFMRCIALAQKLLKRGAHIRFLSRGLPEPFVDMLLEGGMEYISLNECDAEKMTGNISYPRWLCENYIYDANLTIDAIGDRDWDWLILDHYSLDEGWESLIRKRVKKLMVIDDLANRNHDCDLLLDQNYYLDLHSRYDGRVGTDCRLLLGPDYLILREEFLILRSQIFRNLGPVKKIFVFFGGVDNDDYTSLVIQCLASLDEKFHVDVIVGAQNPHILKVMELCKLNGFICHVQTRQIAKFMADADLAIGAGGSSTWERCAMGLPSLVVAVAENQIRVTRDLGALGVIVNLGDGKNLTGALVISELKKVLANDALRKDLSEKSFNLVPAQSSNNLTNILFKNYV